MLKKIFRVIYEYAAITFGSLLVALSLNLFLVPNKIAAGAFRVLPQFCIMFLTTNFLLV